MSGPFGAGGLNFFSGERNFYPFSLDNSLRFDDDVSSNLKRTPTTTTNQRTFAWSGWVKRCELGSGQGIFGTATGSATEFFIIQFSGSDTIFIQGASTPSSSLVENVRLGTDRLFRDPSAWYHIVVIVDTTQATASNRLKLYVNGDLITDFSSGNAIYPTTQNFQTPINSSSFPIQVGAYNTGTVDPFNGYMAEVNFIDAPIFTAATTSGSATVTGISSTASLKEGMAVSSSTTSVIPDGTTISSIDSSTQITLSANATATNGSAPLTFNATIDFLGETKEGIWIAKEYLGPYGTNGFRLDFSDSTTAAGQSTVTYRGNGGTQVIQGVGFSPDLVWIKARTDNSQSHYLFDTLRGADKALFSDQSDAETDYTSTGRMTSFNPDGFTVKFSSSTGTNSSSHNYVAWTWEAGGTPTAANSAGAGATPTAGSVKIDGSNLGSALEGTIPATKLSANTTYGFSIVTYTGTGSTGTIAHGLGAVPKWIIVKRTSSSQSWLVYHAGMNEGTTPEDFFMKLNVQDDESNDNTAWNDTAPTSDVFTVGTSSGTNTLNETYVAYCWCEKTALSKFGNYTGNGSSGHAITTGFAPAWLMVKRADVDNSWYIVDNTRTPNMASGNDDLLFANLPNEEGSTNDFFSFTSTGFTLNTNSAAVNTSSGKYIYMAFADTRTGAFYFDQSGNANNFAATGLEHVDAVPDSPTNNFATLNPLDKGSGVTLKAGNLVTDLVADDAVRSTFHFEIDGSLSFYAEMLCQTTPNNASALGIMISNDDDLLDASGGTDGSYWYFANGNKRSTGSATSYGATWTAGDIIAIAVSGGAVTFYKNNASQGQAFTGLTGSYAIAIGEFNGNGPALRINFGQDSSFGGLKIPQGNSDKNRNGDFFYTPPTDHLALCSDSLANPIIDPNNDENPSDHFNTVTWTATGSEQSLSTGFDPDFVWYKRRNLNGTDHYLIDRLRGTGGAMKALNTNNDDAEATDGNFGSLITDGFTFTAGSSGETYVSWNWKAGGTGVSNTDGDVTSSVSANTGAGFSIVSYTGTGSNTTVGHGLGVAPAMYWVKARTEPTGGVHLGTDQGNWVVYHKGLDATAPEDKFLLLNKTDAIGDTSVAWNDTAPTSSVFSIGTVADVNESGDTYIAYCFAPKDGYCSIGTYIGNGSSSNGAFVFTGLRPAWVMIKSAIGGTGGWNIYDNKRQTFNPNQQFLQAQSDAQENTTAGSTVAIDFLSNGFKTRSTHVNVSNRTYVYLAFAEQPFKYSNAL